MSFPGVYVIDPLFSKQVGCFTVEEILNGVVIVVTTLSEKAFCIVQLAIVEVTLTILLLRSVSIVIFLSWPL